MVPVTGCEGWRAGAEAGEAREEDAEAVEAEEATAVEGGEERE